MLSLRPNYNMLGVAPEVSRHNVPAHILVQMPLQIYVVSWNETFLSHRSPLLFLFDIKH